MNFGGMENCSLSDYEGEISTVLFTIGCPMRCLFCYNVSLLSDEHFKQSGRILIRESEALEQIDKNKKMITAVAISGGEPCANSDLPQFIQKLNKIGIRKIKIDTNGLFPNVLKQCIDTGFITRIAMDLKGPLERYEEITGIRNDLAIIESIELIKNSGIPHEFRITMGTWLNKQDIIRTISLVPGGTVYLQQFIPDHALSPEARKMVPIDKKIVEEIVEETKDIANVKLRGF